MSDYTIKNLKEIDNVAADRGPGLEARFGRSHIDSEHLGVSYFKYEPNFRTPFGHSHREQEEAYVVIGGSGKVKLGDDVVDLGQWDVLRVSPQIIRAFEGGPDGLEIIAVGADRPEGGDGEMVQDFWTE
jgi:mannose-6-phosphate isomerase-like protein (cupin superfamily)